MKNLEDASDELTLMDDDVKIPYYIGEVFVYQGLEKTQVIIYVIYDIKAQIITIYLW